MALKLSYVAQYFSAFSAVCNGLIGPTWGPYVNLKASKVVDGPQNL